MNHMALDSSLLAELKENLIQQQKQLEQELSVIAKPAPGVGNYETNFDNIGTDEDENASEVEEYTDNLAVEDSLEKQLKEIREALERIANGTYGICENCNQEIDIERLKAYPVAKTCLKCHA
jgi:DnaK suppressor protein